MKRVLIGSLLVGALAAACSGAPADPGFDPNAGGGSGASAGSSGVGSSGGAGSGSASGGVASGSSAGGSTGSRGGATGASSGAGANNCGLPADIQALLASSCTSCHATPPIGGAPMPLVAYADLVAPAKSDPSKTVGTLCVTRMLSKASPMPPLGSPAPSAASIATFQAWVNAGMPQAACATSGATGASGASPTSATGASGSTGGASGVNGSAGASGSTSGSSGNAGSGSATGSAGTGASGTSAGASGASGASGVSVYSTPVQCSSNTTWTRGTGATMRPGDTCTTCHGNFLGGTVYPTAHEPTLCDGANATSATVVITDANGTVVTLPVNNVGNFYTAQTIAKPFNAKVVNNGAVRTMVAAQTSGDCNSCHTEQGANGAPGRIMLP